MKIKAEYIWIDGQTPTAKLRSKTKIMEQGTEPPVWGFDGSSTQQATGDQSDCVLNPVATFKDPLRGGENILVMCEVLNVDMTPHASNTRAAASEAVIEVDIQLSGALAGIARQWVHDDGIGLTVGGINALIQPEPPAIQVRFLSTGKPFFLNTGAVDKIHSRKALLKRVGLQHLVPSRLQCVHHLTRHIQRLWRHQTDAKARKKRE